MERARGRRCLSLGGNVQRSTAGKKEGRDGTIWGDDEKVPWTDDDSLGGPLKLISFYLFHLLPLPVRFILRCVPPRLGVVDFPGGGGGGWGAEKHRDTLEDSRRMEQAGILRKFIEAVKAMSEGDDQRGEDNFGSDFMVGPNHRAHLSFGASYLSLPSQFSPFPPRRPPGAHPLPRLLFPCLPQEVRQGRPRCPFPFPPVSRLYMAA